MNKLKEQIKSYQEQLRNMSVMDDYDGGQAAQLRQVIDDLKELDRTKYSKGWYEKEIKKSKKTS